MTPFKYLGFHDYKKGVDMTNASYDSAYVNNASMADKPVGSAKISDFSDSNSKTRKGTNGAEALEIKDMFDESIERHKNPWSKSYMEYLRSHKEKPAIREDLDYIRENTGPLAARVFWSVIDKVRSII